MVATRKGERNDSAANVNPYRDRIIDLRRVPASELVPAPLNPRIHPQAQNEALRSSLSERGIADTLLTYIRADGRLGLIDGHERTEVLGDALVPVVVTDLTEDEALAFLAEHDAITLLALYDASRSEQLAAALDARHSASADLLRTVAETNPAASLLEAMMLREEERAGYRLGNTAGGDDDGEDDGEDEGDPPEHRDDAEDTDDPDALTYHDPTARSAALVEKFGAPPFSVLDTRQGYWQERKRAWLALGIESEIGRADVRGENIRFGAGSAMRRTLSTDERSFEAGGGIEAPALSIFDPALCELVYRWFSPPQSRVLDPFAGGSVRGVVAAKMGRAYTGVELRAEQVAANRTQWARIGGGRENKDDPNTSGVIAEQPRTLAQWMSRLYVLCAQDIPADLGVWPEELGAYLELLCLAHANQPTRLTLASGLIVAQADAKPRRPEVCVLLLSGGKDSVAAGLRAERELGYSIHAVHVTRVNASYPQEERCARETAAALGWAYTKIEPRELPRAPQENLVKNQYLLAVALEALPFTPGVVAAGSLAYHDGRLMTYLHDHEQAFAAFEQPLRAAWGSDLQRVPSLGDEVESYRWWVTLPQETRALGATCMTPARFKKQHHDRNAREGVPLTEYECGDCVSCYERALILSSAHFAEHVDVQARPYPAAYLQRARVKLAARVAEEKWSHTHARLVAWRDAVTGQTSAERYLTHTLSGQLGPQATVGEATEAAYEPLVERVDVQTARRDDTRSTQTTRNALVWIEGDSRELDALLSHDGDGAEEASPYDFLFTCPPYYDLERYSEDARDLSTAPTYAEFLSAYQQIIAQSVQHLADDRFAAIVVGDVRDKETGCVLPFVSDTIRAFEDAGARLYNDAVVVTPAGTLPQRAGRTFGLSRKLGRAHSRLLVFVKGDWRRAVAACGGTDVEDAITLPMSADDDDDDESISAYDPEIIDAGDVDE